MDALVIGELNRCLETREIGKARLQVGLNPVTATHAQGDLAAGTGGPVGLGHVSGSTKVGGSCEGGMGINLFIETIQEETLGQGGTKEIRRHDQQIPLLGKKEQTLRRGPIRF